MRDYKTENFPRRLLRPKDLYLPFPGLYPTRWAIKMQWGSSRRQGYDHEWKYFGKPNFKVAWFVYHVMRTAMFSEIKAREFLKNGTLAYANSFGPHTSLAIQDWDQDKFYAVDPWLGRPRAHMITHWATERIRPLPVIYKGHKHIVYAAADYVTPDRLEAYKNWLDAGRINFSWK